MEPHTNRLSPRVIRFYNRFQHWSSESWDPFASSVSTTSWAVKCAIQAVLVWCGEREQLTLQRLYSSLAHNSNQTSCLIHLLQPSRFWVESLIHHGSSAFKQAIMNSVLQSPNLPETEVYPACKDLNINSNIKRSPKWIKMIRVCIVFRLFLFSSRIKEWYLKYVLISQMRLLQLSVTHMP